MGLSINSASANIDVANGSAVADVTPGRKIVVFHLTKNFDLGRIEDQGLQPGAAFTALGHFKVSLGSRGDLTGWRIGFIQIAKLHAGQAFYAGRISREGSIAVTFERAMPSLVLLDSLADRTPFTVSSPQFTLDSGEITCPTSDHPALKVPKELRNDTRNVNNFLFHVIDNREFSTVLTAIDPGGTKQFLAHFHWQVSHNVKFIWRSGNPVVSTKNSLYTFHGKAKGAPTDSDVQRLLNNPIPPQFNEAADSAMLQSFLGPRGANRTENETRFANVNSDFFT